MPQEEVELLQQIQVLQEQQIPEMEQLATVLALPQMAVQVS
jgi:hypothetical protein